MPQDDDTASELPMYYPGSASGRSSFSRSRTPVEHSCSLTTRNDVPWATLKVNSNASSPKYLPSYFGGQDIVGSVSLDLSKVDTIQSIIVTVSNSYSTYLLFNWQSPAAFRPNSRNRRRPFRILGNPNRTMVDGIGRPQVTDASRAD